MAATIRYRLPFFVGSILTAILLSHLWTTGSLGSIGPGDTDEFASDTVTLVTLFTDEETHLRLGRELVVFTERYPQFELRHEARPYRELAPTIRSAAVEADLVTVTNPAAFDEARFHAAPAPWSGDLWSLYFSRTVLEERLGEIPAQPHDLGELEALFERVHAAGLQPLALGASHGWPLTALLQHVSAAIAADGAQQAWEIAAGRAATDSAGIREAVAVLRRWRDRGWLAQEALELPWTAGVRSILSGEAAFTLLDQQFFAPVPPGRRSEIGFYAFPGDWAIGTVIYLARPAENRDRTAVRELERFLTSPGTVDRLERSLGRPFFGGVQDAALPARLVPSVTADPNSDYHRRLWQTAAAVW